MAVSNEKITYISFEGGFVLGVGSINFPWTLNWTQFLASFGPFLGAFESGLDFCRSEAIVVPWLPAWESSSLWCERCDVSVGRTALRGLAGIRLFAQHLYHLFHSLHSPPDMTVPWPGQHWLNYPNIFTLPLVIFRDHLKRSPKPPLSRPHKSWRT